MKILVCAKQVEDTLAPPGPDRGEGRPAGGDPAEYRMNRFDGHALEEALLIKERFPGTIVHVVSAGGEQVTDMLKRTLGMGADRAVRLKWDRPGWTEPSILSSLIARYAACEGYDLVLAGVMSEDAMNCQVGPLVAAALDIPCAVSVIRVVVDISQKQVTADCELKGGISRRVIAGLPALLTVQAGINRPRYPSLSNMLRAASQKIVTAAYDHHAPAPQQEVCDVFRPAETSGCVMITGSAEEKAARLAGIFKDNGWLR